MNQQTARKVIAEGKSALQHAVLPWREGASGVEVMLVTSRETRRWVVPKGWHGKGLSPRESAAREAREEAGVEGELAQAPLGIFHYVKRLKRGVDLPCRVELFAMKVTRERETWPEKHERTRQWFTLTEAAEAVQEPELKALIEAFEP